MKKEKREGVKPWRYRLKEGDEENTKVNKTYKGEEVKTRGREKGRRSDMTSELMRNCKGVRKKRGKRE